MAPKRERERGTWLFLILTGQDRVHEDAAKSSSTLKRGWTLIKRAGLLSLYPVEYLKFLFFRYYDFQGPSIFFFHLESKTF